MARISFAFSVLFFGLSFASAIFLPVTGMYVSLALLFVASFTMLLASLLRERVKIRSAGSLARVHGGRLERKAHAGASN